MKSRLAYIAVIFVLGIALVVSSTQGVHASRTSSAAGGPVAVTATATQVSQITNAFLTARGLRASDVKGVLDGSVHVARLPNGDLWADAHFLPSTTASLPTLVGFQDGGNSGFFSQPQGGQWTLSALGGMPFGCAVQLPAGLAVLWGITKCPVTNARPRPAPPAPSAPAGPSATPSTGPATAPSSTAAPAPPAPTPPAPSVRPSRHVVGGSSQATLERSTTTRAATTSALGNSIAWVSLNELGVSDTPASLSFSLDCDPYTTLVGVSYASQSGCGVDPRFGVVDRNEEWCADFAKWVWEDAGVSTNTGALTPSAASFYAWGLQQGESMPANGGAPQPGDAIVLFPGAPTTTYADHVGIVTNVYSDGDIDVVNGDFTGTSTISVQEWTQVSPSQFARASEGSAGEQYVIVAPPGQGAPAAPSSLESDSAQSTVYDPASHNLEIYARGSGGDLVEDYWSPTSGWGGWLSLGGVISDTPDAVYDPTNKQMDILVRGVNGDLWVRSWSPGSGWGAWTGLGGGFVGSPDAISDPINGNLEVYVQGMDGGLDQTYKSGGTWAGGWTTLGGAIIGTPDAIYDSAQRHIEVYGEGGATQLAEIYWVPASGWSGWLNLGGSVGAPPSAMSDPLNGNSEVYVRTLSGSLDEIYYNVAANTWSGWLAFGGGLIGSPDPIFNPQQRHIEIYVQGTDDQLYQEWWGPTTGWSGWAGLGGALNDPPSAISNPNNQNMQLYATQASGQLWQRYYDASRGVWSGWMALGGNLA